MTAPNQIPENENADHAPLDPFAFDFFGVKKAPADESGLVSEKENLKGRSLVRHKKSDWYKNLPRLTNAEAEFSNLISNLPVNLTKNAAESTAAAMARYALRAAGQVKCSLVSITEVNLSSAVNRLAETSQVFLTLGCLPENSRAIAALNSGFARALIDSMLGGKGSEIEILRRLSPIETTIVEFLTAKVLGEINNFLGETLLFLQAVKNEPAVAFESFERGAELIFNLDFESFKGAVTLVAPPKFLQNLDKAQNPLLGKKSDGKKLSEFEKLARALDLRLQIGSTFLDAGSLLFLEPDDIVLIEEPQIVLNNENFEGALQVNVGRGRNFRLRGTVANGNSGGDLNFRIEEISSEEARRRFTLAKFKMDEKENELAQETNPEGVRPAAEEAAAEGFEEEVSPSLENVQVSLRVELAGSKISLRELQNLRAGQIIALGCRPTDPVRLVTDNNEEPVATGELVEIEGQLGVRLTKVFI